MMKVSWRKYLIIASVFTLLLGGCSQGMNVSAEEIIHNAIESEKEVIDYTGVSEMKLFEGEELLDHVIIEEFVAGEKRKVVTTNELLQQENVALNDGEKMLMYDEASGQAHEMDLTGLGDLAGTGPKDQFKSMMEMMNDSHTYELVGEEKVMDFDTYHIRLKADEEDSLLGDMELWVDQKTWFIVKFTSETGDTRSELTYTELDFSPEFAEDTFTINIPEDVEIKDMKEEFAPDTVTLEAATEALGQEFLVFSKEDVELTNIVMYEPVGELNRYELDLTYNTKDGIPLFSLSIFPAPEDMPIEASDIEIRGNAAEYEEMIHAYLWDEDGLRYSLLITNPDVDQEEVLGMTERMVLSGSEG